MSEFDFTDDQLAAIRRGLGFGPDDREVTPDDIIAVLEARQAVLAAERTWLDGGHL